MKFSNINFEKKIERKKFFTTAVVGIVTYAILKSFPLNKAYAKYIILKISLLLA